MNNVVNNPGVEPSINREKAVNLLSELFLSGEFPLDILRFANNNDANHDIADIANQACNLILNFEDKPLIIKEIMKSLCLKTTTSTTSVNKRRLLFILLNKIYNSPDASGELKNLISNELKKKSLQELCTGFFCNYSFLELNNEKDFVDLYMSNVLCYRAPDWQPSGVCGSIVDDNLIYYEFFGRNLLYRRVNNEVKISRLMHILTLSANIEAINLINSSVNFKKNDFIKLIQEIAEDKNRFASKEHKLRVLSRALRLIIKSNVFAGDEITVLRFSFSDEEIKDILTDCYPKEELDLKIFEYKARFGDISKEDPKKSLEYLNNKNLKGMMNLYLSILCRKSNVVQEIKNNLFDVIYIVNNYHNINDLFTSNKDIFEFMKSVLNTDLTTGQKRAIIHNLSSKLVKEKLCNLFQEEKEILTPIFIEHNIFYANYFSSSEYILDFIKAIDSQPEEVTLLAKNNRIKQFLSIIPVDVLDKLSFEKNTELEALFKKYRLFYDEKIKTVNSIKDIKKDDGLLFVKRYNFFDKIDLPPDIINKIENNKDHSEQMMPPKDSNWATFLIKEAIYLLLDKYDKLLPKSEDELKNSVQVQSFKDNQWIDFDNFLKGESYSNVLKNSHLPDGYHPLYNKKSMETLERIIIKKLTKQENCKFEDLSYRQKIQVNIILYFVAGSREGTSVDDLIEFCTKDKDAYLTRDNFNFIINSLDTCHRLCPHVTLDQYKDLAISQGRFLSFTNLNKNIYSFEDLKDFTDIKYYNTTLPVCKSIMMTGENYGTQSDNYADFWAGYFLQKKEDCKDIDEFFFIKKHFMTTSNAELSSPSVDDVKLLINAIIKTLDNTDQNYATDINLLEQALKDIDIIKTSDVLVDLHRRYQNHMVTENEKNTMPVWRVIQNITIKAFLRKNNIEVEDGFSQSVVEHKDFLYQDRQLEESVKSELEQPARLFLNYCKYSDIKFGYSKLNSNKEEEFVEVAKSLEDFNSMDSLMKFLDSIEKTYKATPTNNIEAKTENLTKVKSSTIEQPSVIENTVPIGKKTDYQKIEFTKQDVNYMRNVLPESKDVNGFIEKYFTDRRILKDDSCYQALMLFLEDSKTKMNFLEKLMVRDMIDFRKDTKKEVFVNIDKISDDLINQYISNLNVFEREGEDLKRLITENYNVQEKPHIMQLLINDFNKFANIYSQDINSTIKPAQNGGEEVNQTVAVEPAKELSKSLIFDENDLKEESRSSQARQPTEEKKKEVIFKIKTLNLEPKNNDLKEVILPKNPEFRRRKFLPPILPYERKNTKTEKGGESAKSSSIANDDNITLYNTKKVKVRAPKESSLGFKRK